MAPSGNSGESQKMSMYTYWSKWLMWLILPILFLLIFAYIAASASPSNSANSTENSAAILAVITGGAVFIERLTETLWTVVGMSRLGTRWPLKSISDRLNAFAGELDSKLEPYLNDLKEHIKGNRSAIDTLLGKRENADELIKDVDDLLLKIKTLPSNTEAVREATDKALGLVSRAGAFTNTLAGKATEANAALDKVNDFLITLEDNPGRRLISIMLGVFIAVPFAGILGLDVFQAALGENTSPSNLPGLGVALTGIIIGLGATPTHEIIKALQEVKKNRKSST